MQRILYALAFILFSFISTAQTTWEWGFGAGPTIYFGDLGNEKYVPISEINQGVMLSLQHHLYNLGGMVSGNPPFTLIVQGTWHRIGYDETRPLVNGTSGTDLRNFRRGLNFRNDLYGMNVQLIYSLYPWPHIPLSQHKFALYFFVGPGIFHSDPVSDLFRGNIDINNRYYYWNDGTLRDQSEAARSGGDVVQRDGIYETHLRDWYTEGESANPQVGQRHQYRTWQIGFPHGGGIKYGVSRNITCKLEACFYDFPFTDYIDDASYRYATTEEIEQNFPNDPLKQELAKYITDPSGWGSDGENGPQSSIRGNEKRFDWISYFNLQVSIAFGEQHSKSYRGLSHHGRQCPSFRH